MPADAAAHEAVIDRLYAALGAGDGDAMAACYTDDATFEDPAFGRLEDGRGQAMWRMLTARGGEIAITLVDRKATAGGQATAHWLADYTFTDTGRKVHNDVQASFVFRDGLIAAHRDRFDLRVWGAQALGTVPGLLGYTPLLGLIVRRRTSGTLAAFMAGEQGPA
jgi:ketosteroid isomerase-like protein